MRFMAPMIPGGSESGEPAVMPGTEGVRKRIEYDRKLHQAGTLLALDGLHPPSIGARVLFEGDGPSVTDGSFTESKEVLGRG
jgi:hypothetical protein